MRVTNSMMYRNFTSSTNTVHSRLNKSFNKIASGAEYETAADSPLSYYQSKKIDNQYIDIQSKVSLIKDVRNRIYQQELGARDIQSVLTAEDGARTVVMRARTGITTGEALDTLSADLLQKQHEIVNSLNVQYQNFYVYGGNDLSTPPFSFSVNANNESVLTFSHIFPGETDPTVITMKQNADTYEFEFVPGECSGPHSSDPALALTKAMCEQGRIDIGFGTVRDRETLVDTFTGGLNLLTGLTSDSVKHNTSSGQTAYDDSASGGKGSILSYLNDSALGVIGKARQAIDKHGSLGTDPDAGKLDNALAEVLGQMTQTEHELSTVYSDLGNKYNLMDNTYDRLNKLGDSLKERYSEIMGADAYQSIIDMWENQYSYNASLKLGAQLMSSSLFDFMR